MGTPNLGPGGVVMDRVGRSASSHGRRYSPRELNQAVRILRALRENRGTLQGTVKRVVGRLGYGVESVRLWVKRAEVDAGVAQCLRSADGARI
jgi:transposase